MSALSTSNYYYRYQIHLAADLAESTLEKRLIKAQQNTTTHLLLDFTKSQIETLSVPSYFDLNHTYKFSVLIKPEKISKLPSLLASNLKALDQLLIFIETLEDLQVALKESKTISFDNHQLLFSPKTEKSFNDLISYYHKNSEAEIYWSFEPYQADLKNGLTLKKISSSKIDYKKLQGLEVWNNQVPSHYELEPIVKLSWEFSTKNKNLKASIIIPSYNNVTFLTNVIWHLINQNAEKESYEIIVVEDGGSDQSETLIKSIFSEFKNSINLKFIYWPKEHKIKGEQKFFRAGLARNLGVQHSEAETLIFLDSDMLVPPDFVSQSLKELAKNDVIQYQRYHIHQKLSLLNPHYQKINLTTDVYTEEENYWSELFQSEDWSELSAYWKYTCTYCLGLKKSDFLNVGRFKKYYISYGFEDTDLGYELYKRKKKFKLIKTPLLHLTSYNHMQYKNSKLTRLKLLRKTAALFYLQHLDKEIYHLFGNFYSFEKPFKSFIKDLF